MIKIEQLNKSFQENHVLSNLSLEIKPGLIYGLIGPNGAGKSTLMRCIANIYQIDGGYLTVDGIPLSQVEKANQKIFYVSDEPFFLKNVSLKEMRHYYQIFYQNFDESFYYYLLTKFELDENILLSTYSKGMKRQAAIILGLATRPNYLMLDEAFDGLDPYKRVILKQIMIDEVVNHNLSIIIASHNLREINDIADHLCIINHGKIALNDSVTDLQSDYHKFQVAFKDTITVDDFKKINPLHVSQHGKVFTLITYGDKEPVLEFLKTLEPLFVEELLLSLEELFIYYLQKEVPYVTI